MKRIILTSVLFGIATTTFAQSAYEDALSNANYAYAHTKNAYESNNRDHVIEHSDKAVEAFYKVEDLANECGCEDAYNAAIDGREYAEKTATQDTWERSRYYAKRARELGENMMAFLTDCNPVGRKTALVYEDTTNELSEIAAQKAELAEKQQLLAMEQERLAGEIAKQKERQAAFEMQRTAELKKQTILKSKAETALQNLEKAIVELGVVFNNDIDVNEYKRSEKELEGETLDDTKYYYAHKASEIAKIAVEQFTEFAE